MTKILKTVRDYMRKNLLLGLVLSVVIIPLLAVGIAMMIHEGDASRPYIPELRKIADQTPVYPGAQRNGEKIVLKQSMASLFTYYQCDAEFADIEAFYARVLPQQGWTAPQRKNWFIYDMKDHHYWRGDYFIAVEKGGGLSTSFSIVFMWDPQ